MEEEFERVVDQESTDEGRWMVSIWADPEDADGVALDLAFELMWGKP